MRAFHFEQSGYFRSCWRILFVAGMLCGCTQEMYDQPRYDPLEASDFFVDGMSARQPPENTVARGQLWHDHPYFTGSREGQPVAEIPSDPRTGEPFRWTKETLQRGGERYAIYCSVCHGQSGHGDGMIVQRGFRRPPSLHEKRLREETPAGHFFDVISNGFRTMPAYGDRLPAKDRWAIVAYVRALQKSQHAVLLDLPVELRQEFREVELEKRRNDSNSQQIDQARE